VELIKFLVRFDWSIQHLLWTNTRLKSMERISGLDLSNYLQHIQS